MFQYKINDINKSNTNCCIKYMLSYNNFFEAKILKSSLPTTLSTMNKIIPRYTYSNTIHLNRPLINVSTNATDEDKNKPAHNPEYTK